MYNHEDVFYEVVSCENKDFDVYEAKATDTGFEIGIIVSNIEKPTMPEELRLREAEIMDKQGYINYTTREDFIQLFGDEKYADMYEEYNLKLKPISVSGFHCTWENLTDGCYILDEKNNRFEASRLNINRKCYSDFIEENKYHFYETFEITKYNSTDTITVIIDFYKKPVKIVLKKI